jgi:hypothetical protein
MVMRCQDGDSLTKYRSMLDSSNDPIAGYLTEHDFIGEHIRHSQRGRHGFLAFSLAATGLLLGLLMRSTPPRSPTEAYFLPG